MFGPLHAQCSSCGARSNSVEPGQPFPAHQPQGSRQQCPGSGQPAM